MTDIFTEEGLKALIMARVSGDSLVGGGGVSKDDLEKFVNWCRKAQIDAGMVGLFLNGHALCLTQYGSGAPDDIRLIEAQARS